MDVYRIDAIVDAEGVDPIFVNSHVDDSLFVGCFQGSSAYYLNARILSSLASSNKPTVVDRNAANFHSGAVDDLLFPRFVV